MRTEKNVLRYYIVTYQTNGTQNCFEERSKLFHAQEIRLRMVKEETFELFHKWIFSCNLKHCSLVYI